MCFSDILTSLSGRPSICSRVALLLVATPLAGLLSCAWWLTAWSPVHGPREPTSGYVKLLLPPRQSRGNSLVGLGPLLIRQPVSYMSSVVVWDIETVPDLKGFAAANGHSGRSDDEVRSWFGRF